MSITFFVPGQPQGKGRARTGRGKGGRVMHFTPEKTVAYESLVAMLGAQAMAGAPLIDGTVVLLLDMRCQVPASTPKVWRSRALAGDVMPTTKPDSDNVEKAICDGLNGVAWRDDSQVAPVIKIKRYAEVPGVQVTVMTLHEARQRPWWCVWQMTGMTA